MRNTAVLHSYRALIGFTLSLGALTGCGQPEAKVLGIAPASETSVLVQNLKTTPATQSVLLKGEMVEKCPMAGCWFILRDKTGTVRVDTKDSGFVVSDVPLHSTLTVAGKVTPGDPPGLRASGVRY